MSKSQSFFLILVSFIAGVALGSFWEVSQTALKILLIPGLLTIAVFWRRRWKAVFIAFLSLVLIFGWMRVSDFHSRTTYLTKFADSNFAVMIYGYVDDEPTMRGSRQQFVFRVKKVSLPDNFVIPETLREKILVMADPYPVRHYGEKLSLRGKLFLPKNYDDFDYISYLARDQIFVLMFNPEAQAINSAVSWHENIRLKLFSGIFWLKEKFETGLSQAVTEPAASFIDGLLLGSRQNMPADLKNDFAVAGLSHITAISGYNISIVAAAISWILLFFFRRRTAFWISLAAICVFTILTGASASVVRAALMGGLILLANQSGRIYNSRNSLTLAAFLMILLNPAILRFDVGFQLSFFATAGILFVVPLLRPYFKKLPGILNLKETFLATFSAQLMVIPLILFYFKNFSLVALPANLIILFFIPLAMIGGFLAGLAGMIWSYLGLIVGASAWLIVSLILLLVRFFAHLPGAALAVYSSPLVTVLLYLLIFLWLGYLRHQQKYRKNNE